MKRPLFRIVWQTLILAIVSVPLQAFEWRTGDSVIVPPGETLSDDLYATGEKIVIEGVVDGDVVAFGESIVIKGVVKGDLFAAGQDIEILGEVAGNARVAGAGIQLGEKARLGKDLLGAGAGLHLKKGAVVTRDVIFGGASLLLEGNVGRNVRIAAAGAEFKGEVRGYVKAKVGEAEADEKIRIFGRGIEIPTVKVGILVDKEARIFGQLDYTQDKDISFPIESVLGGVKRNQRLVDLPMKNLLGDDMMGFLRTLLTLLLIGLLLLLVFPKTVSGLASRLEASPALALMWGFVGILFFLASLILVGVTTALLAIVLGLVSFGGLLPVIIIGGLLLEFAIIAAFLFVVLILGKIVVALLIGRLLLKAFGSTASESRFVAFLIGLPILVGVIFALSLSVIPSFIGWLFSFIVSVLGLGAVWLLWRQGRQA